MSTPEALQEYAAAHDQDVRRVTDELRRHDVSPEEIQRIEKLIALDSTAHIDGDGFTISRDLNNRYQVRFTAELDRAA